jgi:hypothetical protein
VRRLVCSAVLLGLGASLLVSPVAGAAGGSSTRECRAIAHRMGATAHIDGNTLQALHRSTRMGVRAEVDFAPTLDGLVAFHQNRWEQGSDGFGQVWETTEAYASGLTTTPNGQHVPSAAEVLEQASAHGSRLLVELHHWLYWKPEFLTHIVRKINQLDLWKQVWFTGTRPAIKALDALVDATVLWRLDNESDLTIDAAGKLGVDLIAVSRGSPASLIRPWRQAGYPVTGRQSRVRGYAWAISHRILTLQTNTPAIWLSYCNEALTSSARRSSRY